MCETGEIIKCGDKIRLEHNTTGKNLHSHSQYRSALTQQYEVSAFGSSGEGDRGDDWQIECANQRDGESVKGSTLFSLRHLDTSRYLATDRSYEFTN